MKIGSNEILKAACLQAAAAAWAATPKTAPDVGEIAATAEALYLKWMEVERRQHTHDLSF